MQHLDEGTIHAWLDGELPPAEAEAAEAHAAMCDECKAAVAEARGFIAGASRILLALDAVPGGVLPASTPATATKARAPKRFTMSRAWMAAAAVLVLSTATVIIVRPRRDLSIATVAARDEATSLRADTHSAPSRAASAPMVAAAHEPAPAPSAKSSTNAPLADAQDAMSPSEKKDVLRKEVDRQPMIVAQAPAAPQPERAKGESQTGDPGAAGAMIARVPASVAAAPAPAPAPPRFADSADSTITRRDAATNESVPITGRVLSEAGAPLGSASVTLEGTGIVTLTHDDGSYALTVPASRVDGKSRSLVARLIGYKAGVAPIVVGGNSITQDFALSANALRLGEVVVTGLGTTTNAEKLGSSVNELDSNKAESLQSAPIRSRGTKAAGKSPRVGIFLASGTFAELISRGSSLDSGEPVDIFLYRIGKSYITFIDRLRPDTTRATVREPFLDKPESAFDKKGATINSLGWMDAQGRMRMLRGAVSLDLLRQLKQVLDNPTR